mgnify:CR=1 FL=1
MGQQPGRQPRAVSSRLHDNHSVAEALGDEVQFFRATEARSLVQPLAPVAGAALKRRDRDDPDMIRLVDVNDGVGKRQPVVPSRGRHEGAEADRQGQVANLSLLPSRGGAGASQAAVYGYWADPTGSGFGVQRDELLISTPSVHPKPKSRPRPVTIFAWPPANDSQLVGRRRSMRNFRPAARSAIAKPRSVIRCTDA